MRSQSHHIGIEILPDYRGATDPRDSQSHHIGIEMALSELREEHRETLNRTISELKYRNKTGVGGLGAALNRTISELKWLRAGRNGFHTTALNRTISELKSIFSFFGYFSFFTLNRTISELKYNIEYDLPDTPVSQSHHIGIEISRRS